MEHDMLKKKFAGMRRPPWQLMMTSISEDVLPGALWSFLH